MKYLPLSDDDRRAMSAALDCGQDELFRSVPSSACPPFAALDEPALLESLGGLATAAPIERSGLGVGRYFIPSVVDSLASRGEFVTAYTPYQAECSQGTLEAIFEFQTRICQLTGLAVSNAGLYDGSTAAVEALRMALGETRRNEVVISQAVSPWTREVIAAHLEGTGVSIREIGFDRVTGRTGAVEGGLASAAALLVQSPNVFGVIEDDIAGLFEAAKTSGALPIQIFHPLAATILPKPAAVGAAIAVAEGQPLGIPLSAGGPYLGLIAATEKFMRRMPGRIVGRTEDTSGREAYVLTLQTREQHIRREKATSNICTNQALMALRATIHMAALGWEGLAVEARRLQVSAQKASGGRRVFSGEIFNEYVVRGRDGLRLPYPGLEDCVLEAVTS